MTTGRYKPEKINIVSSADEIGALIDLTRINGESLKSYRDRILESSKNPSNSTYEGLINAINRDLGLVREKVLDVTLKKKYHTKVTQDISIVGDTITDNRSYSGTVDAVNISAVGNTFTSNTDMFIEGELVGLYFELQGNKYKILSNTTNSFKFDGDLSGVTNEPYTIIPDWKDNSLVGLALVSNANKYVIIANDSNSIQTDTLSLDTQAIRELHIEANSPRVHITGSEIILYKDYINEQNFQLDRVIDLRIKGQSHLEVMQKINASDFFEAENLMGHNVVRSAFTIRQQDSDMTVFRESLPASKFFRLQNKNIKEGSIQFSRADIYLNETRDLEGSPFGPFYSVNYKEGIINSKKIATEQDNFAKYVYMDFPFKIEVSPAVVTAFSDKTSEQFLFTQNEKRLYDNPRDKEMSIQPKSDMIEYIAELLKTSRQSWGE